MEKDNLKNEKQCDIHYVSSSCLSELRKWIHEKEKPTNMRCDGWKIMSAHYLLKHIEKNYNISKK